MELYSVLIFNVIVFFLYGIDKYKAVHRKRRIKETILVSLPFFFASIGAMLGMIVFNHKTSKPKFRFLIPFSFLINIIAYLYISGVLH